MNDTPSYSQETFERYGQPPKKGFGCLINSLIGLAVFGLSVIVVIWLIVLHSSLPLRAFANFIEGDASPSNIKVSGLSGSLSKGVDIETITWNDGEIKDLHFRFSGIMDVKNHKQLIIQEIHVGSATLDSSFFSDSKESTETTDEPTPEGEATESSLRLVQIDRVSLNHIVIKNSTTGSSITIPKIEWTGFKAEKGKEWKFGNFEADSDHLVVKSADSSSPGYLKRVDITLMPKLDARILKPIRIVADLGEKDSKPLFDIKAFDQTATFIVDAEGNQQLRVARVNLADFIDAPLPNQFQLDASVTNPGSAETALAIRSGSFLLGNKLFEVQPITVTGPKGNVEGAAFLAICRSGDREIRYNIPLAEEQRFTPVLTSTPAMTPEDLMALLFHDQAFSALSAPDQEKLRKHLSWFSFDQ